MRKFTMTANQRAFAIAKIHIGKTQLGLDDDTYRGMLSVVAGVKSSKDLTPSGIDKVLAHLQKSGATFTPKKGTGKKPNNLDVNPQLKKIEALLTDMGLPWDYLTTPGTGGKSMLEKLTNRQKLEFCDERGLRAVIAALTKKQQKQEG